MLLNIKGEKQLNVAAQEWKDKTQEVYDNWMWTPRFYPPPYWWLGKSHMQQIIWNTGPL